ncbi:hypothetical protein GCM10020001_052780 [Nonomuraea salmonea]
MARHHMPPYFAEQVNGRIRRTQTSRGASRTGFRTPQESGGPGLRYEALDLRSTPDHAGRPAMQWFELLLEPGRHLSASHWLSPPDGVLMPLTTETATAIEQHFSRYGRRRHRLARLYGDTVKVLRRRVPLQGQVDKQVNSS